MFCLKLSAAVFSTLKLQNGKVISGSHHVDQQSDDSGARAGTCYDVQVIGQVELVGAADVSECRSTGLSWCGVPWDNTILTDIHADRVNTGKVGYRRPHGVAGGPHVVEEEDWHGREAEHTEPGHTQNVCQENKQSTDAAAADGGLELAVQLLDCAGCIEALGQQNDPVQEEERSNAIDDILHQLYYVSEHGVV